MKKQTIHPDILFSVFKSKKVLDLDQIKNTLKSEKIYFIYHLLLLVSGEFIMLYFFLFERDGISPTAAK